VAASQHRGKVVLESRYTVTNCYSSGIEFNRETGVKPWQIWTWLERRRQQQNVTVKAPRDYLTEREVEKLMDAGSGEPLGTS
jgi:hypothetical protein